MTDVLLISENYLRSAFMISDNVQSKFILQAVKTAQEIYFQAIVGSCLYERLLEGVRNNDLKTSERELLGVAKRFIGTRAIAELCTITTFKINNIGLNITHDDNVETLGVEDTMYVRRHYIYESDHYARRLQEWILEHRSEFPELCSCGCDKMRANLYSAATCGIFLGGARGRSLVL